MMNLPGDQVLPENLGPAKDEFKKLGVTIIKGHIRREVKSGRKCPFPAGEG